MDQVSAEFYGNLCNLRAWEKWIAVNRKGMPGDWMR